MHNKTYVPDLIDRAKLEPDLGDADVANGTKMIHYSQNVIQSAPRVKVGYVIDNETNDNMEIIWGVNSEGADLECNLWSLNDIELVRWKDTGEYSVSVETVYGFEHPNQRIAYMKQMLRAFTVWMEEKGYRTDLEPSLNNAFNFKINRFKTIEEAYMDFKVRVSGYCALVEDYRGRDPKRIDPLLAKLEVAWKAYPDLRFGQFMTNFFHACGRDPFFVEDDAWMTAIQAYIAGKDPSKVINNHLDESPTVTKK